MTQKSPLKRNSFRCALKRSIPILIGYFPVGFAYGILMQQAGYSFLWSGLVSATVYTGALQMLMISFLSSGVPLLTAALTTSAVTAALHLWRRNTLLSVVAGTACYMLLLRVL